MHALTENEMRKHEADLLYDQYGIPLEREFIGRYVAISRDGQTLLGATLLEVAQKAANAFGPGSYVFKIGQRTVGTWR